MTSILQTSAVSHDLLIACDTPQGIVTHVEIDSDVIPDDSISIAET
jgi:hypothetical protein